MVVTWSLHLHVILHESSVLETSSGVFSDAGVLGHRDTPVYGSAEFPVVWERSVGKLTLRGC